MLGRNIGIGLAEAGHPSRMPALLTQGFRPLFLAAALWAALALALWIAVLLGGATLPSRFDPLDWHVHEMLFGFVMAGVGGFVLTAIPNWTKRPPVAGATLALLAGLWLVGRIACLVSAVLPQTLVVVADLAFPAVLGVVAVREITAGRNWRNLPIAAPVFLLGAANLLMHLETGGAALPHGLGWRLGLAAVLVLISVIGGRIVPTFTRNWLSARGAARVPPPPGWIDRLALGLLHAGLVAWAAAPDFRPVGLLLLAGAAANLWRLARWRGHATTPEPLLLVLHLGYGWLVLGVALLGLSVAGAPVPPTAALHALTTGAIGTMILAVMTRATRGHTGRPLAADRVTVAIYALVQLAALLRILAAWADGPALPLLVAAAACWIGAFALFLAAYWPMLTRAPASR